MWVRAQQSMIVSVHQTGGHTSPPGHAPFIPRGLGHRLSARKPPQLEALVRSHRLLAGAAAILCAAGVVTTAGPAAATASTGVVVNEVYGGGGNSGATLTNDFIELANAGSGAGRPGRLVGAVHLGQPRRHDHLAGHRR